MRHVQTSFFLALLCILYIASTSTAAACKIDPSASFQDDFRKPDPQWPVDGKITYFADNQLAIKPQANWSNWITMPGFAFKDGTFCVDVKTPADATDPDTSAKAGLVFWLNDDIGFVVAEVYPDGNYGVRRAVKGSDAAIVITKTKFEKLKSGPGVVNEIKVTALNNMVTLFLNGVTANQFRLQAPKDGGRPGFIAESPPNKSIEWRFLDLVVNE